MKIEKPITGTLLDSYCSKTAEEVGLLANRGLSGISIIGTEDGVAGVMCFSGEAAGPIFLALLNKLQAMPEYLEFVKGNTAKAPDGK